LINNLNKENRQKIEKKIFSSNNDTFAAIDKRLQDTTIPYLSQDEDKEDLLDKVYQLADEAEILYDANNIFVIKINSGYAMSQLGSSSQWCFASNPDQYWDQYVSEENGFAVMVFNFNELPSESTRMLVVLENGDVYDMYDKLIEDGDRYLSQLGIINYIPRGEMESD